jgi:hypothetical protein
MNQNTPLASSGEVRVAAFILCVQCDISTGSVMC